MPPPQAWPIAPRCPDSMAAGGLQSPGLDPSHLAVDPRPTSPQDLPQPSETVPSLHPACLLLTGGEGVNESPTWRGGYVLTGGIQPHSLVRAQATPPTAALPLGSPGAPEQVGRGFPSRSLLPSLQGQQSLQSLGDPKAIQGSGSRAPLKGDQGMPKVTRRQRAFSQPRASLTTTSRCLLPPSYPTEVF